MKLNKLRGAIRGMKGNPSIRVTINGVALALALQKTPLLKTLGDAYTDETPFDFDAETGLMTFGEVEVATIAPPSTETVAALQDSRDGNVIVASSVEDLFAEDDDLLDGVDTPSGDDDDEDLL